MRKIKSIYLNIVYGDADTIAWQVTGKYPVRAKGHGNAPLPGMERRLRLDRLGAVRAAAVRDQSAQWICRHRQPRTVPRGFPRHLTASWYSPARAGRIRSFWMARTGDARTLARHADGYAFTDRPRSTEVIAPAAR